MNVNTNLPQDNSQILYMVTDIVSAFVQKNELETKQVPELIKSVYSSLLSASSGEDVKFKGNKEPAISIKKSVTPEYIICLEDGKKLKMLKRYLRTNYNMSPEEYRAKWNLPSDYPMVAPNYSDKRSNFAKKNGLGKTARKRGKKQ